MEREYPVPGFEKYTVTEDGNIWSYYGKGGSRRKLKVTLIHKRQSKTRLYGFVKLQIAGTNKQLSINHYRVIMSAKLGRPLEEWEQVRHRDSDTSNNHMSNLAIGCVINNLIDDLENGSRQTNVENIDTAIARLTALKAQYQSG